MPTVSPKPPECVCRRCGKRDDGTGRHWPLLACDVSGSPLWWLCPRCAETGGTDTIYGRP